MTSVFTALFATGRTMPLPTGKTVQAAQFGHLTRRWFATTTSSSLRLLLTRWRAGEGEQCQGHGKVQLNGAGSVARRSGRSLQVERHSAVSGRWCLGGHYQPISSCRKRGTNEIEFSAISDRSDLTAFKASLDPGGAPSGCHVSRAQFGISL